MTTVHYSIKELAEAKGTSAPVRAALLALEARVLELEDALQDIRNSCDTCGGDGSYLAEDITGKNLWWDCDSPICKIAGAVLEKHK